MNLRFMLFAFLSVVISCFNAKAQYYRLVTVSKMAFDSTDSYLRTYDSVQYHYNFGRGSSPDNDTINYTFMDHYVHQNGSLQLITKSGQLFDTAVVLLSKSGYAYTGVRTSVDSFSYSNGRVAEIITYNPNGWIKAGKQEFAYDAGGRIIRDITYIPNQSGQWELFRNLRHTYDAGGLLIADTQSTFYNGTETIVMALHLYNSQGHILKDIYLKWDTTALMYDTTHYEDYVYDGANRLISTYYYKVYSGVPDLYSSHEFTYNSQGRPASDSNVTYSAGVPASIYNTTYEYNQAGRIEFEHNKYYVAPINKYNGKTVFQYKYEIYDPKSITDYNGATVDVNVFPNPASGILNVTTRFTGSKDASVTITDITGRIVLTAKYPRSGSGTQNIQVPVHSLAPGSYFIRIVAGNECGMQQFIIK